MPRPRRRPSGSAGPASTGRRCRPCWRRRPSTRAAARNTADRQRRRHQGQPLGAVGDEDGVEGGLLERRHRRRVSGGQNDVHKVEHSTGAPPLVRVYRVMPELSARIVPNDGLVFAVTTVEAAEASGAAPMAIAPSRAAAGMAHLKGELRRIHRLGRQSAGRNPVVTCAIDVLPQVTPRTVRN